MVGAAVAPYLASQNHEVVRLVRRTPNAGEIRWDPDAGTIDAAGLEGFDGVVHVASMSWDGKWTPAFKKEMRDNRVRTNSLLAETLARREHRPKVLVCASGQGIYPSSGDEVLTEDSAFGTDFLANLQCEGEAATAAASAANIRVVHLRIPMVLASSSVRGDMGRMGDGKQWVSWVARDDLASIIHHALVTDALVGPVNPVSPNPVRNVEFVEILARVLNRKPGLPIPALVLRTMLGEMADALVLASRRIEPRKLLATGYQFRCPKLEAALRHELGRAPTAV